MNRPQVSELLAVKIELTIVKLQQLQTTQQYILAEQQALVEQARADVAAPSDHLYDTTTRSFHAPAPKPVPFSTSARQQAKRVKP